MHSAASPSYTPGKNISYEESYSVSIGKVKVFTLEQAIKARGGVQIELYSFFDLGAK